MKRPKMGSIANKILLFSPLTSIVSCLHSEPTLFAGAEITNREAIQIAKNTFEEEEHVYNLDQMGIKVNKYYSESNPYMSSEEQINFELEDTKTILEKKRSELSKLKDKELIREKEKSIEVWKDALKQWESLQEAREILKNKIYWVVYFFTIPSPPHTHVVGGDFTVFIDSKNGNLLLPIHMGQ